MRLPLPVPSAYPRFLSILLVFAFALFGPKPSRALPLPWDAPTNLATLAGAQQIDTGDIDGDGDIDLMVAADVDDEIAWLENDDGSWISHTITDGANGAFAARLADVNRDGTLDVVVSARDAASVRWLSNDAGDGSSWSLGDVISSAATGVLDLEIGDLDRDGDVDVVAAIPGATDLRWWEQTGAGWTERILDPTAGQVTEVELADIDGDGDLDVIAANPTTGKIKWRENPAPATTTPWTEALIADIGDPAGLEVVDLDRDGDPDVLVGDRIGDNVELWSNDGTGAAGTWTETSVGAFDDTTSILAADLDRDGTPDIVVTGEGMTAHGPVASTLAWFANDGAFTASGIDGSGPRGFVAAADIDADGDPDLVTADPATGAVELHRDLAAGRGAFFPLLQAGPVAISFDVKETPSQGDIDGDGDLDLVFLDDDGSSSVSMTRVVWAENLAAPGNEGYLFMTGHVVGPAAGAAELFEYATHVDVADLDGDGDGDILVGQQGSVVLFLTWCQNLDGSGTDWSCEKTAEETVGSARDIERDMTLGDVDGDGNPDLFAYIENWDLDGTFGLRWYENLGLLETDPLNAWREHEIAEVAARSEHEIVDIDGDGDADVVALGDFIEVWLNDDGVGTSWTEASPAFSSGQEIAIGDIDLDGDLDIAAVAGVGANYRWWEQGPGVTWTLRTIEDYEFGTGLTPSTLGVDLADMDLDGDLDVLGSDRFEISATGEFVEAHWFWYENRLRDAVSPRNGSRRGTVDEDWHRHELPFATDERSVYAIDLDGDADPDFLVNDGPVWQWGFRNMGATLGGTWSPLLASPLPEGEERPIGRIDLMHDGQPGDRDVAVTHLRVRLLDEFENPLGQADADALLGVLRLTKDTGDGSPDPSDLLLASASSIVLTDGTFEVDLGAPAPSITVPCCGIETTWFLSLEPAAGSAAALPETFVIALDGVALDAVDTVDDLPVPTVPFYEVGDQVEIRLFDGLFADGFESGDTSAWTP